MRLPGCVTGPARWGAGLALVLATTCACGPEGQGAPGPTVRRDGALRPGDGLLERLPSLRIEGFPPTNLPADIAAPLVALMDADTRWEIPPASWQRARRVPTAFAYHLLGGAKAEGKRTIRRWRVRPEVGLDLELGQLVFEHEGRSLRRQLFHDAPVPEDYLYWTDTEAHVVFWWDRAHGFLVAVAEERPGPVSFRYEAGEGLSLGVWEWHASTGGAEPPGAADLTGRFTLAQSDRPALAAPAPTVFALDVPALEADALQVAVAVLDQGFGRRHGVLQRVERLGDGVTFAVELVQDGIVSRVWQRHVDPAARWVEDTVDLSGAAPGPVTLRLVTEPGPRGEASFDYALWSGLRVMGESARPPQRPHVVFLDLDTLRADRLGCYGYERETSPHLDAWAGSQAVVYTNARSVNNWTLPSTASMLTGLAVSQHGVVRYPQRLAVDLQPLAVLLGAAGYETYGRSDGGYVIPAHGFSLGFDLFEFHAAPTIGPQQQHAWRRELERLRVRRSERPVLCFVQTYMAHAPYQNDPFFDDPEQPYDGPLAREPVLKHHVDHVKAGRGGDMTAADWAYMNAIYDAGVRRMDAAVGRILEALPEIFGDEPYLVVVTSDHGEELSERGDIGHGQNLHKEQLAVPFIVRYPDGVPGRDDRPVSSLDIVPTILDVVGLPGPGYLPGRSLAADPGRERMRVAQHMESAHAIEFGGYKLVRGRYRDGESELLELYDTAADPGETRNLAGQEATKTESLARRLELFFEAHPPLQEGGPDMAPYDPEHIEQLEGIGYIERR